MDFETLFAKTPATLDEIKRRVAYALERHPLCRDVQFDVVGMPRSTKGGNWTISLANGRARCAVGGVRYRRRYPGCLRTRRRRLILRSAPSSPLRPNQPPGGTVKPYFLPSCRESDRSRIARQANSSEMESYLSKAMTIVALTGFLVVGAAAAAILGRESVPAAGAGGGGTVHHCCKALVSNRESKGDRLTVAPVAPEFRSNPRKPARSRAKRAAAAGFCGDAPAEIEGLKVRIRQRPSRRRNRSSSPSRRCRNPTRC